MNMTISKQFSGFGSGLVITLGLLASTTLTGCQKTTAAAAKPKPPEVFISFPTEETVTEVEESTGRTMAQNTVEIRARVTGYLDKVNFRDGSDVKQGETLAEVDPRSYQAAVDGARATVLQGRARLDRMKRQLVRAQKLYEQKTITDEAMESAESDHREADATLQAALASQAMADLNLDFTKITSPLPGQISRRLVDPGNLVKSDDTIIATIVSLDPIFVYFDVDERTVLRIRRLIQEGKIKSVSESEAPVRVGLADETDFPLVGLVNFVDNQVDPTTGTLRLRAVIRNESRLLSPGMFVRVQLPVGEAHPAILLREEALGADQGQRFVYVVNDENKIVYRQVKVGMAKGNRRVIESGLQLNEKIVISGLQRVRPGIEVQTRPFESMKELSSSSNAAATPKPAPEHSAASKASSSTTGEKKDEGQTPVPEKKSEEPAKPAKT